MPCGLPAASPPVPRRCLHRVPPGAYGGRRGAPGAGGWLQDLSSPGRAGGEAAQGPGLRLCLVGLCLPGWRRQGWDTRGAGWILPGREQGTTGGRRLSLSRLGRGSRAVRPPRPRQTQPEGCLAPSEALGIAEAPSRSRAARAPAPHPLPCGSCPQFPNWEQAQEGTGEQSYEPWQSRAVGMRLRSPAQRGRWPGHCLHPLARLGLGPRRVRVGAVGACFGVRAACQGGGCSTDAAWC